MSRPNISYPTPIPSSSSFGDLPSSSRQASGSSIVPRDPRQDAGPRQASVSRMTAGTGSLDSHITRLLVNTKQLLQGLESWASGSMGEDGVSDVYVKLGNGFEVCVSTFRRAGIPTEDLESIPQDLRECLEEALSGEQNQDTLNQYLPTIRTIIYNLLNGLKVKQGAYKRAMAERERERQPETPPPPIPTQPQPTEQPRRPSRGDTKLEARLSGRSGTSATSQTSGPSNSNSPAPSSSGLPPVKVPSSQALAERQRTGPPSRPAPPDAFRPPRMRATEQSRSSASPSPAPSDQSQMVRHQLVDKPVPTPPPIQTIFPPPPPKPGPVPPRPDRDRSSRDSYSDPAAVSRFSLDSDITNGSPVRSPVSQSPPQGMQTLQEASESALAPPLTIAPSLPTLNLPSTDIRLSDPPTIESMPDIPPETRATLAALGKSDALERRASKRYSSYTFNKILPGSPSHKKAASVGSPQRPSRRAAAPPPMPALPESLASNNLAVAAEEERKKGSPSPSLTAPALPLVNGGPNGSLSPARSGSPASQRFDDERDSSETGSVRIVKTPDRENSLQLSTPRPGDLSASDIRSTSTSVSVFLQIGQQVKKARLELPISMSSLRLMFMERFEYDPGMEDFPDVYLRDNRTGVQFELEDMEDLKDGSVLSLNIEPLDQVKQHIDMTFATMMQELKEMKTSLDHSKRVSMSPAASFLSVARPPTLRSESHRTPSPINTTSASFPLPHPAREAELRAHFDEVQSLRRDLAVMRQVHVDFLTETKDSFSKLRTQNSAMREVVKTKMGGSRALLDNSKTKLEGQCAETIQAVEEISDIIDAAREDAFRRFVSPSRAHMVKIKADLGKATEMVEQFTREVTSVEPTWRATWHFELSRVMEEQKLLPYQAKLCADLKNDIKDATDMLANVSDFVNQRQVGGSGAGVGVGRVGSKGFRPASPDTAGGGGIPNLLMEIRTKEGDPNQRLRAIEAQQKARERERANEEDEFSSELAGFVGGRKLKKTGGTEEAERLRQKRQDQTIKRMLSSGETPASPPGILSPQATGETLGVVSRHTTGSALPRPTLRG